MAIFKIFNKTQKKPVSKKAVRANPKPKKHVPAKVHHNPHVEARAPIVAAKKEVKVE